MLENQSGLQLFIAPFKKPECFIMTHGSVYGSKMTRKQNFLIALLAFLFVADDHKFKLTVNLDAT